MDGSSVGTGFMAVFVVSGSVVLLGHHLHKCFLSDFMKKMEDELVRSQRSHPKKKVRFADDVVEPSSANKEYRRRHSSKRRLPIEQHACHSTGKHCTKG